MVNFIFLSALVRAALRPDGVDKIKVAGFALIKFLLLYLSGYCLLKVEQFEPLKLLIGFSTLLVVIVLKVITRALLGLDEGHRKGKRLPGAV